MDLIARRPCRGAADTNKRGWRSTPFGMSRHEAGWRILQRHPQVAATAIVVSVRLETG
jgi:hypothetical protein